MVHPVFKSQKAFALYILAWVLLISSQAMVLYYFYNMALQQAIGYSLIFYSLFSLIALLLWYPVSFIYLSMGTVFSKILNFVGLAAGAIAFWELSGSYLLKIIFEESEAFLDFNQEILPVRLLAGILIFMIISLVYYLIIFYTSLEEKRESEFNLRALAREAELKMLKYQMNPHFLFNSLNSINSLTITDPGKARDMIVRLSDYLRYSLESGKEDLKELKLEVGNIRRYLEIEKTRFGERVSYEEDIDEQCFEYKLPAMILQPLFENAIKHSVHESTEAVSIKLKCRRKEDYLQIEIKNIIVENSNPVSGTGTGLDNVRKRLFSYYGEAAKLELMSEDGWFKVRIQIPFSSVLS